MVGSEQGYQVEIPVVVLEAFYLMQNFSMVFSPPCLARLGPGFDRGIFTEVGHPAAEPEVHQVLLHEVFVELARV